MDGQNQNYYPAIGFHPLHWISLILHTQSKSKSKSRVWLTSSGGFTEQILLIALDAATSSPLSMNGVD
jgi:hypothetical protein